METALWITGEQEHYGRSLRRLAELFAADEPPSADGITLDPARFALAAWQAATEPGYLSRHPRVLDAAVRRPPDVPHLLAVVELAAAPPFLPSGWTTWQQPEYTAPADGPPTALGRLELRLPVPAPALPTPTHPQAEGLPNLMDAQAAVEALLSRINEAVAPFLAPVAPVALIAPDAPA